MSSIDIPDVDDSPGVSSFSGEHEVKAVAQTFVIAHEIKSLTFTTSRTGITVKDLVCGYFIPVYVLPDLRYQ